jgi:hypothetical protein
MRIGCVDAHAARHVQEDAGRPERAVQRRELAAAARRPRWPRCSRTSPDARRGDGQVHEDHALRAQRLVQLDLHDVRADLQHAAALAVRLQPLRSSLRVPSPPPRRRREPGHRSHFSRFGSV